MSDLANSLQFIYLGKLCQIQWSKAVAINCFIKITHQWNWVSPQGDKMSVLQQYSIICFQGPSDLHLHEITHPCVTFWKWLVYMGFSIP